MPKTDPGLPQNDESEKRRPHGIGHMAAVRLTGRFLQQACEPLKILSGSQNHILLNLFRNPFERIGLSQIRRDQIVLRVLFIDLFMKPPDLIQFLFG